MRGEGQIAELTAIARPEVGVIVNVGPAPPGTARDGRARRGRQGRADPRPRGRVRPASYRPSEPLLAAHLREDLETVHLQRGGDVTLASLRKGHARAIDVRGEPIELELSYGPALQPGQHARRGGRGGPHSVSSGREVEVAFSAMRGEVVELAGGVTVVNDCYNANPMSMRAALDHLAATPGRAADSRPRWHG